jgi:hypothetical protein
MHVATWLFERCILGMMAGRTRVLVTHQIQFLSKADLVVVMHEGKVCELLLTPFIFYFMFIYIFYFIARLHTVVPMLL